MRLNQRFQRIPLLKYMILLQLCLQGLEGERGVVGIKLSGGNAMFREEETRVVH
jgi:hypothetical protein